MSQSAKPAFVATHVVTKEILEKVITDCIHGTSWYFLRSPHKVSGIKLGTPPNFADAEGQIFNYEREVRWKRRGNAYEVLLLSATEITDLSEGWNREDQWYRRELNASPYTTTETRLPNKIDCPEGLNIGQRYFIDADTGTVHFIAITGQLNPEKSKQDSTQKGEDS